MNKFSSILIACFVLLFVSSCHKKHEDIKEPEVATRTVLMYLIADNNISGDIYRNIASVEEGLMNATSPGTFVIYWDGGSKYASTFPVPTLFKYVVDKDGTVSEREVIQTYPEQNSCSPEVITKVINDVKNLCKAESYGLIFGSHATGWLPANTSKSRSLGDDGGYKIEIPELNNAILDSGVHFDFILMDACLMSQVEVAYELRHTADYLILSPAEVMAAGFPYKDIVKYLLAIDDKEANVISAARQFVDFYRTEVYQWATIAVVKTVEMDALASAMRNTLEQYHDNLTRFNSTLISTFQRNYGYGRTSLANSSYDVRAFVKEITDDNIPSSWEAQLNRAVVFSDYVNGYVIVNIDPAIYSGIGCYIPHSSFPKWNAYYQTLQWYSAVGWDQYWNY